VVLQFIELEKQFGFAERANLVLKFAVKVNPLGFRLDTLRSKRFQGYRPRRILFRSS
jgi:hypothetical protein